jgi:DNA-directed RNA polymerase specialized sigma24 family protein
MEQMVEKVLEPQVLCTEDVVPNPEAVPPDRILEEKQLLEELQGAVQSWPGPERETFELYFVQGFEPLATVQGRLRKELLQEEARIAA